MTKECKNCGPVPGSAVSEAGWCWPCTTAIWLNRQDIREVERQMAEAQG